MIAFFGTPKALAWRREALSPRRTGRPGGVAGGDQAGAQRHPLPTALVLLEVDGPAGQAIWSQRVNQRSGRPAGAKQLLLAFPGLPH